MSRVTSGGVPCRDGVRHPVEPAPAKFGRLAEVSQHMLPHHPRHESPRACDPLRTGSPRPGGRRDCRRGAAPLQPGAPCALTAIGARRGPPRTPRASGAGQAGLSAFGRLPPPRRPTNASSARHRSGGSQAELPVLGRRTGVLPEQGPEAPSRGRGVVVALVVEEDMHLVDRYADREGRERSSGPFHSLSLPDDHRCLVRTPRRCRRRRSPSRIDAIDSPADERGPSGRDLVGPCPARRRRLPPASGASLG